MKKPLAALLVARAVTAAAAVYAGANPLRGGAWIRWDSNLYLSIAQRGYFLEHCGPGSQYGPAEWCGNAGWFPLYAWLLRLVPGVLLSLIFEAALLWLLRKQDFTVLLLAAVFPGCIYQQAVFPVSLFLACAVAMLQRAWPLAAPAAMAYPTGFLLVPVALVERNWRAVLSVCAGFAAVLLVLHAQTGHWNAYFLTQQKYGFHFAFFDTLFAHLKPLVNARYRADFVPAAQTLLVLIIVALALTRWRDNPSIAAYTFCYWAFPLCLGGHLSLYRAEALLVPSVLLVPQRARLPLLVAAAPVAFAMSVAFFRGTLV